MLQLLIVIFLIDNLEISEPELRPVFWENIKKVARHNTKKGTRNTGSNIIFCVLLNIHEKK